jgi:UDPglucose--hexose-1-phosphate uridylyltransferase
MQKLALTKPDGRRLLLYGREPVRVDGPPPVPDANRISGGPHLRWHPLREEWVAYAPYRQDRTFLPPPEYDPLAPTTDPRHPTELPSGTWEIAAFENRFPALTLDPPASPPPSIVTTALGLGACEVVVFTPSQTGSLGGLPLAHVELLMAVWADRTAELGGRADIDYVMPFENRGVEVGVTLHHPHGQIYAYPFVPPIPARELAAQRRWREEHDEGLLEHHIREEQRDGRRLLYDGPAAVAFVPACARYPYEIWVAPRRAVPALPDADDAERRDLARALKTVLLKLDGLWQRPFPYVMVIHQAPLDGLPHPEAHLHWEIYPAFRSPGRLKYLAGTEIGAGMFANDALPEEKAAELQAVVVEVA